MKKTITYSSDLYEAVKEINDDFRLGKPLSAEEREVLNSIHVVDSNDHFADLKQNWHIYSDDDFRLFICVIYEHCFEKGITNIEDIYKCWVKFKQNLENVGKHLRNITVD